MKKIVLLAAVIGFLSTTAQAGLYRWVDEAGNVHYSDKMPASVSKKKHTEIVGHGLVKKKIDPEAIINKTIEKKEALGQEAIEKQRLEEIAQINREKKAELLKRDNYLLSTYDDKGELVHYFENKIKMLEGNSNILLSHNLTLKKKVMRLTKKKAITKHKQTLDSIKSKIGRINKSIDQYNKALKENSAEIVKLSDNYAADMQRYVELTKK